MKSTYIMSLFLMLNFLCITCKLKHLNSIRVKETQNVSQMWANLFNAPKGESCKEALMRKAILSMIEENNSNSSDKNSIKNDSKFSWIKRWGFGLVAYLFDYLDPVFAQDAINNFFEIYEAVMKESANDTVAFADPFVKKDNIDLKVYNVSANANQINSFMPKANWFITPGDKEFAISFISKYDINNDGRLNPRELILGAIMHNRNIQGSDTCLYCFQKLAQKIDALFIFIDCNDDGILHADELVKGLASLNRSSMRWNIFSIRNNDNIRISAINDFILKNGNGGVVDKEAFRAGILLGFWDRQLTEKEILTTCSRNLKELRWTDKGMTDTIAYKYYKDKILAELMSKQMK